MRKIEEVLRLHHAGRRSNREIAQAVRVSPTTVADYLRRAPQAGLSWPLADGLTERAVESVPLPPTAASCVQRPEPDWAAVHRQLGRSGVTLELLWQEYRERHPDGYQYSAFCLYYRAFAQALPVTLRQSHAPSERLFVDYSGQTVPVIDAITSEEHRAQIFVAVLGAWDCKLREFRIRMGRWPLERNLVRFPVTTPNCSRNHPHELRRLVLRRR